MSAAGSFSRLLTQPFGPALQAAKTYSFDTLGRDLLAAITVAAVAVPQAMAYAIVAGVAPEYGLYTVIIQSIIGSLVASNRFLSLGPINTQSLLVASVAAVVLRQMDPGNGSLYLQIVVLLTLAKGVIQLLFAAARLGALVRYVSASVTIGFTAGAGVLIAAGQIGAFLGYHPPSVERAWPGLIGTIQRVIAGLPAIDGRSVLIGILVLGLVIGGRRISHLFPGPLLGIVLGGVLVWAMGWSGRVLTIDPLPTGGIPFAWPRVDLLNARMAETFFMGAIALALLGLLEAYSIGRSIGARSGDRVNANDELVSQGLTGALSSFFQCIPGSGSFSRSELNYQAGAQTTFAGMFNGLIVLAVFLLFAGMSRYVPLAALAAILFVIASSLIDWRFFLRVRRASRTDAVVCLVTFVATLVLPLQYAVYIGVLLNIGLYLNQASRLHLHEMVPTRQGPFIERPIRDRLGTQQVMFLQLEGDLFFAVADELQDRLAAIRKSGVKVIIFRLKRTHMIDATVMDVLDRFVRDMRRQNGHVLLCGVKDDLMRAIRGYGLVDLIGRENVFPAGDNVFASAKAAVARARELVARSIDVTSLQAELDLENRDDAPLNYQI